MRIIYHPRYFRHPLTIAVTRNACAFLNSVPSNRLARLEAINAAYDLPPQSASPASIINRAKGVQ